MVIEIPAIDTVQDFLCELEMTPYTGKYLSEALILASTDPQYDDRLFIELWVQYMKTTC